MAGRRGDRRLLRVRLIPARSGGKMKRFIRFVGADGGAPKKTAPLVGAQFIAPNKGAINRAPTWFFLVVIAAIGLSAGNSHAFGGFEGYLNPFFGIPYLLFEVVGNDNISTDSQGNDKNGTEHGIIQLLALG